MGPEDLGKEFRGHFIMLFIRQMWNRRDHGVFHIGNKLLSQCASGLGVVSVDFEKALLQ